MVKLEISISPTMKLDPAWKSSSFGENSPHGIAGAVRRDTYTGISNFLAITERPETWSVCSCVIRMASIDSGETPAAAKRSNVSFRLSPASINRRGPGEGTSTEMTQPDDERTET